MRTVSAVAELVVGIMEGNNRLQQLHREWVDADVDWCRANLANLKELRYFIQGNEIESDNQRSITLQ